MSNETVQEKRIATGTILLVFTPSVFIMFSQYCRWSRNIWSCVSRRPSSDCVVRSGKKNTSARFIIISWLFLMILGAVLFSLQSFFCIELLSKLLKSYIIGTFILLKNLSHVNQIDSESGSVILLTLRPKLYD